MYVFIFSKLFLARKYLLQMKMYPVELFAEVHDTGIFAKKNQDGGGACLISQTKNWPMQSLNFYTLLVLVEILCY